MSRLKQAFIFLLCLFICLALIILTNTLRFSSQQLKIKPIEKTTLPSNSLNNFSKALQIKTISHENPADFDSSEFEKFNQFLYSTYTLTFAQLEHHTFNQYSHLLKWTGTDENLNPIILMGHTDVVPIASPDAWEIAPFSGVISEGLIWGRGTIDDKMTVIGLLESVESLLKSGFEPQRTIYLAFGHDEEIGGDGAQSIAKYLFDKKVKAEFILDEGLAITQKIIPGIDHDIALIGIAEKGFSTLELSIELEGGHSSMPAKETAIDVLATAVSKLKANPMPRKISTPMHGFIKYIGPEMNGLNKVAFANQWLFKPLILNTYENLNAGNALIRTTISPTIFNSGIKENVIPRTATALINFRLLPGDTQNSIIEHTRNSIDDKRISINTRGFQSEASRVSPINNFGFKAIQKSIYQIYPDVIVGPNLVVGATDSRHYQKISDNIYRFVPYKINQRNIGSFHGINENISVDDFEDSIRFYQQLIKNAQ